jgi:hypothetical protein
MGPLEILLTHPRALPSQPNYTQQDLKLGGTLQLKTGPSGWKTLSDGWTFLPRSLGHTLTKDLHDTTHLGPTKLTELLRKWFFIQNLEHLARDLTTRCSLCQQFNQKGPPLLEPGMRIRGSFPQEQWEIDFTEIKPGLYGYTYLLVMVDTFSRWTEAFPTKTETAQITVKKTLTRDRSPIWPPLNTGVR